MYDLYRKQWTIARRSGTGYRKGKFQTYFDHIFLVGATAGESLMEDGNAKGIYAFDEYYNKCDNSLSYKTHCLKRTVSIHGNVMKSIY